MHALVAPYTTPSSPTECPRLRVWYAGLSAALLVSLVGLWGSLPPAAAQGRVVQQPPSAASPTREAVPEALVRHQEQRRFARLQRKGVIAVQRRAGTAHITINPLLWRRLTPEQQQNFLQRAQRLYGGAQVEIASAWTREILARLTADGLFESYGAFSRSPEETPESRGGR